MQGQRELFQLMTSIRAALAELVAAVEFNDGKPATKKTFVDLYEAAIGIGLNAQAVDYAAEYEQYTNDLKGVRI